MPFLRFKGFQKDFISSISSTIIQQFSKLTGVVQEKIKIELLLVEQLNNSPLSLEIYMFPRDQELHDNIRFYVSTAFAMFISFLSYYPLICTIKKDNL
ncbi:MAG: hypothetical protein K0Q73_2369 [Paenibacillus sp.]|jgi:hypothetical protein|nr:hypothetical protein [Paenibacillus sp.]